MDKIIFVTSNQGKVVTAGKHIDAAQLEFFKYDLIEPRSESLEEIAAYKVMQAYEIVKEPCIAVDAGFYIEDLNGWPSSFVNFNLEKLGLTGIMKLLNESKNRNVYFKECLAYYDGIEVKYFYGICEGTLTSEIRDNDNGSKWGPLWSVFIPKNCIKTLAEMTDDEREERPDCHSNAITEFSNWYK